MPPTDDPLDRLRAELQELGDEAVEEDVAGDALLERALRHLQSDDLHPITVDLMASVPGAVDLPPGEDDRARARVERAAAMLREQAPDAAVLLRKARERAGISDREAAAALALSPSALKRIEGGRGVGALLNKAPEQVAAYVRRLDIDPRIVLASLFATTGPGAVLGYTPRVADNERGDLLEAASAAPSESDREWALAFLMGAARRE